MAADTLRYQIHEPGVQRLRRAPRAVGPSVSNLFFSPSSSVVRVLWRFNVGRFFVLGCTPETWQRRKLAHLVNVELEGGETPRGFFPNYTERFFFLHLKS